jgi:hypothetical protein
MHDNRCSRAALEAHDAGISVVPPREDGSKAPDGLWKAYLAQMEVDRMTRDEYALADFAVRQSVRHEPGDDDLARRETEPSRLQAGHGHIRSASLPKVPTATVGA